MPYYKVLYVWGGAALADTPEEAASQVFDELAEDASECGSMDWGPTITEVTKEEACQYDWLLCEDDQ